MAPAVAAGIATAVGSLAGAGISGLAATSLNKRNRIWQENMLQKQQDYNRAMAQMQMDYQDKINQQNFDWNDPKNIRARLEAAGYNPFLADANTSGMAAGTSFGTGTSSLGTVSDRSPLDGLAGALGNGFNTVMAAMANKQQMDYQATQNELSSYQLNKLRANDDVVGQNGKRAYTAEGEQKLIDLENARNQANISDVASSIEKMRLDFLQAPAVDENSQPLTDEAGNAMNNFQAMNQGQVKKQYGELNRLLLDIQQGKVDIANSEIDGLIKKYNLTNILPAQLQTLQAGLGEIQSRMNANNASASASMAAAESSRESAATTRGLRPYEVSVAKSNAGMARNSKIVSDYDRTDRRNEFRANSVYRSWKDGWFSRYSSGVTGWLGHQVNNIIPVRQLFK